jgi:hypothetical protein
VIAGDPIAGEFSVLKEDVERAVGFLQAILEALPQFMKQLVEVVVAAEAEILDRGLNCPPSVLKGPEQQPLLLRPEAVPAAGQVDLATGVLISVVRGQRRERIRGRR